MLEIDICPFCHGTKRSEELENISEFVVDTWHGRGGPVDVKHDGTSQPVRWLRPRPDGPGPADYRVLQVRPRIGCIVFYVQLDEWFGLENSRALYSLEAAAGLLIYKTLTHFRFIICGLGFSTLSVLGLLGNIMSLFILSSRSDWHSGEFY